MTGRVRTIWFLALIIIAGIGLNMLRARISVSETTELGSMELRPIGIDHSGTFVYTNGNAPDAVLFWHFLQSLYIDKLSDNRSYFRYLAPGLNSDSDAEVLREFFVDRYLLINMESRDEKSRILSCDNALLRPSGSGIFALIDSLDGVEIAIYGKHLAISEAILRIAHQFDLTKAIRNSPSAFSKSFVSRSGATAEEENQAGPVVDEICEALAKDFDHVVDVTDPEGVHN